MSATTRRSTRRTAASAEPTQSASDQSAAQDLPPSEAPKRKGRKPKATSAQPESQTVTESQESVTKVRATSRANAASASTTTTTTTTASTTRAAATTAQAPGVAKKTRAGKAAAAAVGAASPLRSLDEGTRSVKRARGTPSQKTARERSKPVSAPSVSAHDENDTDNDQEGLFFSKEFDSEMTHLAETTPAEPVFVNGTESALALLHKIENAAKESTRIEPSIDDSETFSDNELRMESSPQQPTKRPFTDVSATPEWPAATSLNIFSRSFSAIKSRLFSSTPKAPSTPEVASPTPSKSVPPRNTITETLSVPPTPIGERVRSSSKKRAPTNIMMRVLLKGVDHGDLRKAETWAKQIIPDLRNDPAFREKRKRLEATVLFKDLTHLPSSKPWETGFGDPLGDLDDDDVVPVWAVYQDLVAAEEEHQAKKHKKTHDFTEGADEVPSIDEQYAANNKAHSPPKLYNSHGQSASIYDLQPRRSTDPSPMFATSIAHSDGGNPFNELQGHDTAAQIRENDREVLKTATKVMVRAHDPTMGSFSVPEDSDEDDSIMNSETSDAEPTQLWTQPPPPAPVPAHAPLPGATTDSPSVPTAQQPVDEVERQRQRLMKHTPAKPSRLREATYPSPSLFSEAGNESLLTATPIPMTADVASMFADMPGAELIDLDEECQAVHNEIVNSEEFQRLAANDWPAATLTYESEEEDLSPVSAS